MSPWWLVPLGLAAVTAAAARAGARALDRERRALVAAAARVGALRAAAGRRHGLGGR